AGPGAAARPTPALEEPAADRRGGQGDLGARIEAGAAGRAAVDPGRRAGYSAALADGDGKRVGDRDEGSADALVPIHRQRAGPGAAARPAPALENPTADRRGVQDDRGPRVE